MVVVTFIGLCLYSCNPECENFARVNAVITPRLDLPTKSYLIATSPSNYLDDRDLFVERLANGELVVNESTSVQTQPFEGGYLVAMSDVEEGNFNFYVRDNDCGGFIPLNSEFVCESLAGVQAEVIPSIRLPGEEVVVSTTPANFLADKQIYIQKAVNNSLEIDENNPLESRYVAGFGGRIATLPMDAVGNTGIFIRDEVCGGFIPLNSVRVADQAFINSNPAFFVTPSPPTIVIPPPTIAPPTNVVNTWFSPDNRDYCIWFLPEFEVVGIGSNACLKEGSNLIPGNSVAELVRARDSGDLSDRPETVDFTQIGSWELNVGCTGSDGNLYAANPVSGTISKATGEVQFVIDRTSKGLGLEHYDGNIVQTNTLPEYAQNGGVCGEDDSVKPEAIMVVTSQETGKQMILFRQAVFGVPENRLCE